MGRIPLTLMVSGKTSPYIGDQWEEYSLCWWSVEKMLLHWWAVGRRPLTLVISGKNAPYIDGQLEECSLHW
ncbi:unnamed protein product [Staurois parvus]|uniref:Uncharacterized protein n=1 Tax=Staurois parvus TaxID=386267 RepID=A0ABN9B1J8_9NEOB|nr:unnamed protein product [Staurois parvus]